MERPSNEEIAGLLTEVQRELADRGRADDELEKFRELLECSDQVYYIREEGALRPLWVSPSYQVLTGRTVQSALDDPASFFDAIVAADRPRVVHLQRTRPGGFEAEYRIRRPDDTVRWVRARSFPLSQGPVVRMGGILDDITARKQAEARFAQLADVGLLGIVVGSSDWHILEINDTLLALLGYARDEILSGAVPWRSLTPSGWAHVDEQAIVEIRSGGIAAMREKEYLHRDGHRVPVLIGSALLEGTAGDVISFVLDLSERRRAERDIDRLRRERAADARFRALLEAAPDATVITDAADRIVLVNAQAERMFNHPREDMLGRGVDMLVPAEHGAELRTRLRAGAPFELVGRRRDGPAFPIEVAVGQLETDEGGLWSSAIRDITSRKKTEEALTALNAALQDAMEAADASSRAKSAFLANMSHEIRTPMNAILGYTQLLQRDRRLQGEELRHLAIIAKSGEHLLDLINDVLEMSKIEAGHHVVTTSDVDLRAVVDDLERMFRLRADVAGLSFAVVTDPGVPTHVRSDERKLRQVLVNLLGNAVKFTREGGVVVQLSARPGRGGSDHLFVEIRDTGPGIAPAELARLFQPFSQAQVGLHARGGTGLGLALSRQLARLMEGDVSVESRPGEGSVFVLSIPLVRVSSTLVPPTSRPRARVVGVEGAAPRVLVVDDDPDNRGWATELLAAVGFTVLGAADGAEALAVFDDFSPRLVLMDLNMPVMDGYAAIRALRARPSGAGVAIVALTASAFDDDREGIFAAGADGWLRKPCREAEILAEIERHLQLVYRYAAASAPPTPIRRGVVSASVLPEATRTALRAALEIADHDRLSELVSSLHVDHAALAEVLDELAQRFAYEEIGALLRSSPAAGEPPLSRT